MGAISGGGPQHGDERGQQGDAGSKGDAHAGSGDDSQLGHAAVGSRQEGIKARGSRRRRQGERAADFGTGGAQCQRELVARETPGAEAHAKLNREIDAEPDKEHGERHRNQVERAEEREAERRGDHESDDEARRDRQHELPRAQRQPEQDQHGAGRDQPIERGAVRTSVSNSSSARGTFPVSRTRIRSSLSSESS